MNDESINFFKICLRKREKKQALILYYYSKSSIQLLEQFEIFQTSLKILLK